MLDSNKKTCRVLYVTTLVAMVATGPARWGQADSETTVGDIEPGGIEVVRERYPNTHVKIERETTLDSHGNYVNHGSWKMWDTAGNVVAEGQYNMGKRSGQWTRRINREQTELLSLYASAVGHLASRVRAEEELRRREAEERDFHEQLSALHEVTVELSKAETFDDLCRQADGEGGSYPVLALHGDVPTHHLAETSGNRQPQPGSTIRARRRGLRL